MTGNGTMVPGSRFAWRGDEGVVGVIDIFNRLRKGVCCRFAGSNIY